MTDPRARVFIAVKVLLARSLILEEQEQLHRLLDRFGARDEIMHEGEWR